MGVVFAILALLFAVLMWADRPEGGLGSNWRAVQFLIPSLLLLVALLSAALMGVAKVSIRKMADTEPPRRIVFWFGAFSTLISAVPLIWVDQWPNTTQLGWMLAIGLVATIAQICMTTAYQLASPGQVGVYNYTAVIWAASLGWLIWDERLQWSTLLGTLLIVSAGIWNLRQRPQASSPR